MVTGAVRSALVAGGAGFIGSHLCERLVADGLRVYCLDSLISSSRSNLAGMFCEPRFTFIESDVLSPLPDGLAVDLVVNLASAASPRQYQANPVHTMMTHVVGTDALLRFASQQRARFVQASTSRVYGVATVHPQFEAYFGNVDPTGLDACHEEGQRAGECLCFDYLRRGEVDVRVARIFDTYGPRASSGLGGMICDFASRARTGRPILLQGDGSEPCSLCHVDDVVEGCVRLMKCAAGLAHPVNLGNPAAVSMLELAQLIRELTCSDTPIAFDPSATSKLHGHCPDITIAQNLLAWQPTVGLMSGLTRTIAWLVTEEVPSLLV